MKQTLNYKQFRKLNKPKEHEIQTEIMNYLLSKGIFVQRINSGAIKTEAGNRVRLAPRGTPDLLIGIPHNKLTLLGWIEVKTAIGKLSFFQEAFRDEMAEKNICYIVARSVEDAERGLKDYLQKII